MEELIKDCSADPVDTEEEMFKQIGGLLDYEMQMENVLE